MKTTLITRGRIAAIAASTVVAAGVTAGAASAAGSASLKGDMTAGGIHVKFNAKRPANSKKATGFFTADGSPVAAMGVDPDVGRVHFSGPISCLETHGQDASFYYDFDKNTTPGIFGGTGSGMIVTLVKSNATKYRMGFTPMLSSFVPMVGCDSGVAPLSVTKGGWQTGK